MKARSLLIALLLVPAQCLALDGSPDSTAVLLPREPAVPDIPYMSAPPSLNVGPLRYSPDYLPLARQSRMAAMIPDVHMIPGIAPIAVWDGGSAYADGSRQSLPGLMNINSASLNLSQTFGAVTVTAFGQAMKYGYFRGLTTTWGFGASATWRLSERVSITAFGSYYTGAGPRQPAMAGYTALPRVGGYVDWQFSERWGVRAGVQSYRTADSRWETQPIVEPYFKVSKHCDIGVDVGGILYQLVRSRGGGHRGNPTIAPPATHISDIFGQ